MRRKNGFTLVEVLFVVLIAAGVIAFSMPAYQRMKERSAYNAATGTLLDIGNAVNSLERDLKTATGITASFPHNPDAPRQVSALSQAFSLPNTFPAGYPWNKGLAESRNTGGQNEWNNRFWAALVGFGYLKPISNWNYDYFVFNGTASPGTCKGRCTSSNGTVRACMCKSGTKNGCYYGAVFLQGGTIERITEDDTSCKKS